MTPRLLLADLTGATAYVLTLLETRQNSLLIGLKSYLSLFAQFEWPALRCAQGMVSVVTETRSMAMRGVYPNALLLREQ